MIITVEQLKAKRACASQVAIFAGLFPDGMPVTRANLQRCAVARLDLDWAAGHLLPRAARDAYYVALKPLDAAYEAACKPLADAYDAALKPLDDAYEAALADALYEAARDAGMTEEE